jgi:GMP reductase
LEREF